MRTLTPAQAGVRLGITDHAVRDMIAAGRLSNLVAAGHHPAAIPYDDITRVQIERRNEALRRVGDETEYAHKMHRAIWPAEPAARANGFVDAADVAASLQVPSGRDAVRLLPSAATMLWGNDVLVAAATKVPSGTCRTCMARAAARVHETLAPRDSEAHRVLLGPPCTSCRESFVTEARNARRELQKLRVVEQEYRDRRTVEAFRAEQRQVLATVRQASRRFAELEAQRKRLGLPPEGRGKR